MPITFEPIEFEEEAKPIAFEPIQFEEEKKTPTSLKPLWELKPTEAFHRLLSGPSTEDLGVSRIIGTPESENSILPEWKGEPDTYWKGFAKSLYNDVVRPFGTPSGIVGNSGPKLPGIHINSPEVIQAPLTKIINPIENVKSFKPFGLLPEAKSQAKFVLGSANKTGIAAPFDAGPIADATVMGWNKPKGAQPTGSVLDLAEKAEQDRLAKVFYTDRDLQGGTALELPDKRTIESPVYSGDTRLGFERESPSNLEYPLNVVPNRVRPRSTQTVINELTPESFKEPIKFEPISSKIEQADQLPETFTVDAEDPKVFTGEGTARPGEPQLPSAVRETVKKAADNTGLHFDSLADTFAATPEPIKKGLETLVREESNRPSFWKSTRTELEGLSPELAMKDKRSVQFTRQMDSRWVTPYEKAIGKLSKTEKENFGSYVEGSLPITSPIVDRAVKIWKAVEDEIGDTAKTKGLRMFAGEENIPFEKNPNYWPHIPSEKISDKDFIQRLVDSGMSRDEASKVQAHYRNTGELKVGAQFSRVPGSKIPYRADVDAGLMHIRSMSKRIAQHQEFGPLDIQGTGAEGISDLIEATSNPTKTKDIMKRLIGRDEKADEQLTKWLDRARKYSAITKLQNFTIPNMILGQGTTALKASSHPLEAIKEVSKLFSKQYRNEMQASGVWQNFSHTLAEEMSKVDPYLIGAGETFNRGIAGATGKAMAREYLKDLRVNPNNKMARKELSELLATNDLDSVIAQDVLTNDQLNMAAGRMAEITQGLTVPGNLPYHASSPVNSPQNFAVQLAWMLKKMGYQATKSIWDSMKANPKVNVPLWIGLSQVGGELTGDVKAGLKGMWTGDPGAEINKRGDWWLESAGIPKSAIEGVAEQSGVDSAVIARMLDNFTQYFFLGLPADLIQSTQYGPGGLLSGIAGPVLSDVSKFGNNVMKMNMKGIERDAIRSLPVPGSSGLGDLIMGQD